MPVLKIKTLESKVGWTNPNNSDMVSYDVTIDVNGRTAVARTFSRAIGEVGFEGEVETYEKNEHTYLKQLQPEGGYNYPKKQSSFTKKPDNSDGQRQGMCINNAANYVNSLGDLSLTAKTWAEAVHEYATALYSLGDLQQVDVSKLKDEVAEVTDDPINLSDVEELFK